MAGNKGGHELWLPAWKRAVAASIQRGGEAEDLVVLPPAREQDVRRVESELRRSIPDELRTLFAEQSRAVRMVWRLPEVESPHRAFKEISGAEVEWNLEELPDVNDSLKDWKIPAWDHKLAFIAVGNGDFLALDLANAESHAVVYLDHEGESVRYIAPNLTAFLERWSVLGCPGPDLWGLEPFLGTRGLEPDGENGRRWREWFGIDRTSSAGISVHAEFREPLVEEKAARVLEEATPLKPNRETEAWNLARMCLERQPDLTLRLVERLQAPSLRAEAPMLRIAALNRLGRLRDAQAEAHRTVTEWLAPATSQYSINQVVSRAQLLAALDGIAGVEILRDKVAAAREPEMFLPDGDFM